MTEDIFADQFVLGEMLNLRRGGTTIEQLATKYQVSNSIIERQIKKALPENLSKISFIKMGITELVQNGTKLESIARRYKITKDELIDFMLLTRIQQNKPAQQPKSKRQQKEWIPRPGWRADGHGGWLCNGKTSKELKDVMVERKQRELEEKRKELLNY
jgi:Mor family transcriptional regulator